MTRTRLQEKKYQPVMSITGLNDQGLKKKIPIRKMI